MVERKRRAVERKRRVVERKREITACIPTWQVALCD